ncbi:MAG TPA: methyltransferase domain-containing protein [Labilithrix sp.]|nr:methyltransferase domain-containing protein [Labilithrix sp.]
MSDERVLHHAYWQKVPVNPEYPTSMSKMLLMDDPAEAERDGQADTEEVLALVPTLPKAARIIELAAGVGRFTPKLVELAGPGGSVLAYDFVEDFCAQNRAQCRALGLSNVDVRAEDVLVATFPSDVDLVFASWIFMYLANAEVDAVLAKIATALRPGGSLVFRESCVKKDEVHDGEWPRFPGEHPCRYRSGRWYSERLARLGGHIHTGAHVLRVWDDANDPNAQLAWVWQKAS